MPANTLAKSDDLSDPTLVEQTPKKTSTTGSMPPSESVREHMARMFAELEQELEEKKRDPIAYARKEIAQFRKMDEDFGWDSSDLDIWERKVDEQEKALASQQQNG